MPRLPVPLLKSQPPGPQNVTGFGDSAFKEARRQIEAIWVGTGPVWLVVLPKRTHGGKTM